MWTEIASGSGYNVLSLSSYENRVAEGERAKLSLSLSSPVSPTTVQTLLAHLQGKGVTDVAVSGSGNSMEVTYRKSMPWVAIIIAAILLLAILIVSWRFYHELASSPIGWGMLLVVGFAIVVGMMILLRREKG
jgi:hypothetical protein